MRPKGTVILGFLLLLFVGVTVVMALGYPPRARLVPLAIGVPTLAMLIYALIGDQFLPQLIRRFDVSITDFTPGGADEETEERIEQLAEEGAEFDAESYAPGHHGAPGEWKRVTSLLGWMVAFIATIVFVGFLVAIPIFTLIFLKLQARASWLATILVTVVLFAFVYVLFGRFFPAGLFQGIVFGAFLPPL
jgi:hypothetical protein